MAASINFEGVLLTVQSNIVQLVLDDNTMTAMHGPQVPLVDTANMAACCRHHKHSMIAGRRGRYL